MESYRHRKTLWLVLEPVLQKVCKKRRGVFFGIPLYVFVSDFIALSLSHMFIMFSLIALVIVAPVETVKTKVSTVTHSEKRNKERQTLSGFFSSYQNNHSLLFF